METKNNIIVMHLFAKKHKSKDGKDFTTYFVRYADSDIKLSISTNLTNDVKSKIQLSKLQYPLKITLTDGKDYFLSTEPYDNENGIKMYKDVLVIKDYTNIEELHLPDKTLKDFYDEKIGQYIGEDK